jgi:hypothetical protein
MNAVIQSSAHPLVVPERTTLITHALLNRLSADTGSTFRVSDLRRGKTALSAQHFPAQHPLHRFLFYRAPFRRRLLSVFQASSLKTAK